jgi:maltodextrin utilization protein YvdJ
MKQKIAKLLIFIFFLSTVGIPISLHFCEMQKTSAISMCEVCTGDTKEKVNSCCEEEVGNSVQLKSNNSKQCCDTKIIDKSISDNFISVKLELKQEQSSAVVYITDLISKQLRLSHQLIDETSSPPETKHNDLYLQNSILLI